MIRKLTAISLLFLIIILMIGCAGSPIKRAAKNSLNLVKLKIGMTKNEVINLMGEPSKTEAYEIQGKNLEFWLYLTEYSQEFWGKETKEYTPLAFEGNILKGWGRNYYDQALRIKQEIKIEQK